MKGTPRSVWLSWANQAAGIWASTFTAVAKRNQTAFVKAITTPPKPAKSKRRRATKR